PDNAVEAEINLDEQAEKGLIAEQAADADTVIPAEVAAIHEDNESAQALNQDIPKGVKPVKNAVKKEKPQPKSKRSPKHIKASEQIEKGKLYSVNEAIELVKAASYSRFDGSVELHLKLTKKKAKSGNESTKGIFHLPHGSGKIKNIIVLDEAKIEQIAKTKKIDFDIAIATPELMPKVGKIAKILGPRGLMPDPKSGTVTDDPKKAIAEINSGKIEYRIDAANNIHQLVGKCSWDSQKLAENINAILSGFQLSRVAAAYLTASMAPSVSLDLIKAK
ncbi:MAG: hypothetical protein WD544_00055, partial [Patescibacteria group bacterium]